MVFSHPLQLQIIGTITSLSTGPGAEFLSDLESRMWDRLPLHLVASHTVKVAMRRRSLQERENKRRLDQYQAWAWGCLGTASVVSVKGPSRVNPGVASLSFFLLLAKLTKSAKTRFNKYKNVSKLLIS